MFQNFRSRISVLSAAALSLGLHAFLGKQMPSGSEASSLADEQQRAARHRAVRPSGAARFQRQARTRRNIAARSSKQRPAKLAKKIAAKAAKSRS